MTRPRGQGEPGGLPASAALFAAVCTTALHTTSDVDADAVVETVHDALRPGGRFVVLDGRRFQTWPATVLNPLFERVLTATVNHRLDRDPLAALPATFASVEVRAEFDLGAGHLAVARKAADRLTPGGWPA